MIVTQAVRKQPRLPAVSARPEVFLYPAWRGHGVYCDAFGMPSGKYEVWGQGRRKDPNQDGAPDAGCVIIDYLTRLDTGVENAFEWAIRTNQGPRFRAHDRLSGQEARGMITPTGFSWTYKLLHRTPFGVRRCTVEAVFEVRGTEASTSTTLSLMGVTVGTSSSHIRHLG